VPGESRSRKASCHCPTNSKLGGPCPFGGTLEIDLSHSPPLTRGPRTQRFSAEGSSRPIQPPTEQPAGSSQPGTSPQARQPADGRRHLGRPRRSACTLSGASGGSSGSPRGTVARATSSASPARHEAPGRGSRRGLGLAGPAARAPGRLALDALDLLRDTPPILLGREVRPAREQFELHRVGSRELQALEGDTPATSAVPTVASRLSSAGRKSAGIATLVGSDRHPSRQSLPPYSATIAVLLATIARLPATTATLPDSDRQTAGDHRHPARRHSHPARRSSPPCSRGPPPYRRSPPPFPCPLPPYPAATAGLLATTATLPGRDRQQSGEDRLPVSGAFLGGASCLSASHSVLLGGHSRPDRCRQVPAVCPADRCQPFVQGGSSSRERRTNGIRLPAVVAFCTRPAGPLSCPPSWSRAESDGAV
jgi:hypothetical protein